METYIYHTDNILVSHIESGSSLKKNCCHVLSVVMFS